MSLLTNDDMVTSVTMEEKELDNDLKPTVGISN